MFLAVRVTRLPLYLVRHRLITFVVTLGHLE